MNAFQNVNYIIHAGDVNSESVIYELESIAPLFAVAGNTDSYDLTNTLGTKKVFKIGDVKFGLTHGNKGGFNTTIERVKFAFSKSSIECAVFGHSHIPFNQVIDGVLYFNPGSPTDKRRQEYYSYGILTIENNTVSGEIIYF